ncbi:MAG: zf-HC2 domain-containing protein [Actinobacteria bacterium]|nr:zf-HC2 domain-containing protein [Actinomycetota bacterium]
MDHSEARRLVSLRMDGERLPEEDAAGLDRHLGECPECSAWARRARRVREAVRFEVVPAVPDLVGAIMVRVRAEAREDVGEVSPEDVPARGGPPPAEGVRPQRRLRPRLARLAAAALVGAIVGSVVAGRGLLPGGDREGGGLRVASAAEVSEGVARAAASLSSFRATYAVTESHFHPDVPVREFTVGVWFSEPERFRLQVADHTAYPGAGWPRNDLTIVVDGPRSYASLPPPCPVVAFPDCPLERRVEAARGRAPFSGAAGVLADAVLPLVTLADPARVSVLGPGRVGSREALRVELAHRDAEALLAVLREGGTWRPFHPDDRVVVWLDPSSWFPLQYRVFPAPGAERRAWGFRFGLPEEDPARAVFSATVLSLDTSPADPTVFSIPEVADGGPAAGGVSLPFAEAVRRFGRDPVLPVDTAGLLPYRGVVPSGAGGSPDEVVLAFARGLSWLKVRESRSWAGDEPFGAVGVQAERVELPGGGVAFYEPATGLHGRRVSIHADGVDLYLETNLSREALLEVAASLPVRGGELPESWRVRESEDRSVAARRVSLEEAARLLPFPLELPSALPPGFGAVSAEIVEVGGVAGVTVYLQGADRGTPEGIRLHLEPASDLPPVSGAEQFTVAVGRSVGRWTPDRALLEWVSGGVYRSLSGPGFELDDLLAVAASLRPAGSDGGPA